MNFQDRAILVGMVLGDSHIGMRTRYNPDKNGVKKYEYVTAAMILAHSMKQKEYLEHKADLLHNVFGGNRPTVVLYETFLPKTGKTYGQCRFQKTHKYFQTLFPMMYSNNKKKYITRQVLDMLTPQGIAIWYMDDGHTRYHRRVDGTVKSNTMEIHTCCSEQEVDEIIKYFDEVWNIQFNKAFEKRNSKDNEWYVRCNTKEGQKLSELIKPYIIPCMQYKIGNLERHECQPPALQDEDIVCASGQLLDVGIKSPTITL